MSLFSRHFFHGMPFRRQLGNNSVLVLFPFRGFQEKESPPFFPVRVPPTVFTFACPSPVSFFYFGGSCGPRTDRRGARIRPSPDPFFSVRPSGVIRQRGKKEVSPVPPRSSHAQLGSRGSLAKLELISLLARVFSVFNW